MSHQEWYFDDDDDDDDDDVLSQQSHPPHTRFQSEKKTNKKNPDVLLFTTPTSTAEQHDKRATRELSTGPGGKLPAIRRDRSKTKVGKGQMRNTQDPDMTFHEILVG